MRSAGVVSSGPGRIFRLEGGKGASLSRTLPTAEAAKTAKCL